MPERKTNKILIGDIIVMRRILTTVSIILAILLAYGCTRKPAVHPVAIIGVDGLEWRLVRRMIAAGELPNLKRIIETGTTAEMDTLEPILSPAIFTTMATGVLPERHGITWFMVKDANDQMIPVTSAQRKTKAIWNMVSEKGLTSDIIGWWGTWPAEKIKGNIVSDHMGYHIFAIQSDKVNTDIGNTYPEKLNEELAPKKIDPFSIPLSEVRRFMKISDIEYNVSIDMKALCARPEYKNCLYCEGKSDIPFCHYNPLHHFLRALATFESFTDMSLYLLHKKQPDLFMVYFEFVDTVSHQYMKFAPPRMDWVNDDQYAKYSDVIRQTYIRQDEVLGKLLAALSPDTNVIILSDHGFKIEDERLKEEETTAVAKAHLWHHAPAFLAMIGPDIRKGGKQIKARVQDITPTALALLGLPVADDMDGKVLKDALEPAFLQKHPIQHIPSYESEKDKKKKEVASAKVTGSNIDPEIKEHLKALGYIGGDVDDSGLEMNRAHLLMEKGDKEEAIKVAEGILAQNPKNLKAIIMLGDLYLQQQRFDKAAEAYSKVENIPASELPPGAGNFVANAIANWGIALMNMGDLKNAETRCQQAVARNGSNYLAHFCLGRTAEIQQKSDVAINEYKEALRLNPDSAETHNNLGNCYLNREMYVQAIEEYKKASEANPSHVECHHNAGIAYERINKLNDAQREFEAALKLNPNLNPSLSELGNVRMKMKKYDEAADTYLKLAQLNPGKPGPLFQAARARMSAGDVEEAVDLLKKARATNPRAIDNGIASDPLFRSIKPEMLK